MEPYEKGHPGGGQEKRIDAINGSTHPAIVQDMVFAELADLPRFVPYRLVPKPDKPGKSDKVPWAGTRGLSTRNPLDWKPLADAKAIAEREGLDGVGLVLTNGIEADEWVLAAIDADDVDPDGFEPPFSDTYAEMSPSRHGMHLLAWVPKSFLSQYADTLHIVYDGCHHLEAYIGTSPRFITLPGATDETFIYCTCPPRRLTPEEQAWLASKLKPAEAIGVTAPAVPIPDDGKAIDLTRHKLSDDQQALLAGKGQSDGIDRSKVMRGLLIRWIDAGESQGDILATVLGTETLWRYALDHRNNIDTRALLFAREEITRAYKASMTGKRERLLAFGKKEEPAPEEPDGVSSVPPGKRKPISQRLKEIKPYIWLVEDILPKGHFIALLGPPNSGKTAIALDMALRVALGKELGQKRIERSRVVYIAAENPEEVMLRIKLWCDTNGVNPAVLDGWFEVIEEPVFFDQEAQAEAFRDEWADTPPGLVAVDTFSANYSGESENSATDVMRWFNHIRKYLIQPFGCAVVVLHHPPKHSDNPFEWRGSGGAAGTLDSTWGAVNDKNTITLMQGKHRSPVFGDLYWKHFTSPVKGHIDNYKKPTMSVVAMPTDKINVGISKERKLLIICAAIDAGITDYRRLSELSGHYRSGMGKLLKEMKSETPKRSRLLGEQNGKLKLTVEGKEWAEEGRILSGGSLDAPAENGGEK